ncbi:hypothetical protein ACLOJK_005872 [Asimina triloba]
MAPSFAILAIVALITTSFLLPLANAYNYSVRFGYYGDVGPTQWGSLSPDYQLCSNGKQQSPINIVKKDAVVDKQLTSLNADYSSPNATLVDNGFNVAVSPIPVNINAIICGIFLQWEGNGGAMNVDGKNYTLKQLHWHSPSEHTIDGARFPVELHLVHQSDDGNLAVMAVLYKHGDADDFLTQLKGPIEELTKESCSPDADTRVPVGNLDTECMKKATNKYFRYTGSLTVPPCTENVIWSVLVKVRELTKEQVAALKAPLDSSCKNNARPVQPLNDRKVTMYEEDSSR